MRLALCAMRSITPTFILPRQGGGDFVFLVSASFDTYNSIFIKIGVAGQPPGAEFFKLSGQRRPLHLSW